MSNFKPVETYNLLTKKITIFESLKECAEFMEIKSRTLQRHLAGNGVYAAQKSNRLIRFASDKKWNLAKINKTIRYEIGSRKGRCTGTNKVEVKSYLFPHSEPCYNDSKNKKYIYSQNKTRACFRGLLPGKRKLLSTKEFMTISEVSRYTSVPYSTVYRNLCIKKLKVFYRIYNNTLYEMKIFK